MSHVDKVTELSHITKDLTPQSGGMIVRSLQLIASILSDPDGPMAKAPEPERRSDGRPVAAPADYAPAKAKGKR